MHVHNFCFPDDLMKELKELSEETGAPVSELLRRAAKEYLEKINKNNRSLKKE